MLIRDSPLLRSVEISNIINSEYHLLFSDEEVSYNKEVFWIYESMEDGLTVPVIAPNNHKHHRIARPTISLPEEGIFRSLILFRFLINKRLQGKNSIS
jgi:hypothetical protein